METNSTAFIALGANLGNRQETMAGAIAAISALPSTTVVTRSSLYLTKPVDADGDDYINAVVEIRTELDPEDLLESLLEIEDQFGRTRSYHNAPRPLDCDLLLYDQQVLRTPTLILPHPRMHLRAFVLVPLVEIAPTAHIPNIGPAQAFLALVETQGVRKLP
jgi:2-amino-4-hydroxy-6-hydroxymethyldihydropteridine diphosphokinase